MRDRPLIIKLACTARAQVGNAPDVKVSTCVEVTLGA
jgi:hypothetical protein